MAHVLVTGSADGIGRQTAATLAARGHRVVLHARSGQRAATARAAVPDAADVLVGDLASLAQVREMAERARTLDRFDVVVHNAGVIGGPHREVTGDGLESVFAVNVVAPYLLTALLPRPDRLVYLSSGMQAGGELDLTDLQRERRPWSSGAAYSDSKLCDVLLAFAVARRWAGTCSNAVDPGWIRTRMGGAGAPGELTEGADTPVWLAEGAEPAARVTGRYLHRRRPLDPHPVATDPAAQDGLLDALAELTGTPLPG